MQYTLIQNTNYLDNKYDFWEVNSEFKFVEPYITLYNKGKAKKETSVIMWAIFLLCDLESPKSRLRIDERKEDIIKYFIEDEKFDFDKYKEYIDVYPKIAMTKIQRELKAWADKIEERSVLMESMTYDLRTLKTLDEMLINYDKIWKGFNSIYKQYQSENLETRARGGREESFAEKLIS